MVYPIILKILKEILIRSFEQKLMNRLVDIVISKLSTVIFNNFNT